MLSEPTVISGLPENCGDKIAKCTNSSHIYPSNTWKEICMVERDCVLEIFINIVCLP